VTHLPKIHINIIAHNLQEYDTAGNYAELNNKWAMWITELPDWKYEACLLIHELVEMCLTKAHNVDWKLIDAFDINGEGKDHPDPGTLKSAPYHNEHMLATQLEKRFAKMLGVDWNEYNRVLDSLEWRK